MFTVPDSKYYAKVNAKWCMECEKEGLPLHTQTCGCGSAQLLPYFTGDKPRKEATRP